MKVFVQNFIQENDQCLRALLDVDKSQWREMTSILSRGKNDEVEALERGRILYGFLVQERLTGYGTEN